MGDIDVTNTPVGKSVVVADTSYIKSVFSRVSEAEGVLELYDPSTGKAVLRSNVSMSTGGYHSTWFDRDFWNVYVDGKPLNPGAGSTQGDISWDPKSKIINITTK
ncbi:MAG TPA: hypothetical protein VF717_09195 [Pyrinomonadaceae bacterium]|jgi:hypothetical protein